VVALLHSCVEPGEFGVRALGPIVFRSCVNLPLACTHSIPTLAAQALSPAAGRRPWPIPRVVAIENWA